MGATTDGAQYGAWLSSQNAPLPSGTSATPPASATASPSAGGGAAADTTPQQVVMGPCFSARAKPQPTNKICPTCQPDAAKKSMVSEAFDSDLLIIGTAAVNPKMRGWLQTLKGTSVGGSLLAEISRRAAGKQVMLWYYPLGVQFPNFTKRFDKGPWTTSYSIAAGHDTEAKSFDRNTEAIVPGRAGEDASNFMIAWDDSAPNDQNPGACLIGHELIHVLHGMKAEDLGNFPSKDSYLVADKSHKNTVTADNMEEARTIGLRGDGYFGEYYSENSIRAEMGAPLRSSHAGLPGDAADSIHSSYVDPTPWPTIP